MFDAIVVGAGPAGATTARLLAQKGFKVLLIEKENLPRPKLCAGAVSIRAKPYLPNDWENAVINTVYGGNLGFKGEIYLSARCDKPVVKIVERRSFDLYLTIKAKDEGVTVREGESFINFHSLRGDFTEVVTTKGVYKTKYLIGADGALSKVLRVLGVKRKTFLVCEALVETRIGNMDEVFIDLGLVKWGYAWVFPHGEELVSVGIASLKREERNLKLLLRKYIENHSLLKGKKIRSIKSWFLSPSRGGLFTGEGNIFLVGEASGSVDALLGEGIYYSVWQAHLLAECLKSQNHRRCYSRSLKRLKREFLFGYLTGFLGYSFQRFMFKNAKERDLKEFFKFLRGEKTYADLFKYGVKRFLSSLFKF